MLDFRGLQLIQYLIGARCPAAKETFSSLKLVDHLEHLYGVGLPHCFWESNM